MNHILPTRVSVYDFLYQDTKPLTALLADVAQLSLPQTEQARVLGIQAITAALLAYQQHYDGSAIIKKLLTRSSIKELRQYNAVNFKTMFKAVSHGQNTAEVLFAGVANRSHAFEKSTTYIAQKIDTSPKKVSVLLNTLSIFCLRELAILTDYAHFNHEDVDNWLKLQAQFLANARFQAIALSTDSSGADDSSEVNSDKDNSIAASYDDKTPPTSLLTHPPLFDDYWYEVMGLSAPNTANAASNNSLAEYANASTADGLNNDSVPHYAKVIGRSIENASQSLHDELLQFSPMPAVTLPQQRWLLQLAKISDVYLSRNRLKINSEPKTPPSRPLINIGGLSNNSANTPATASEKPIEYDKPKPLWRDPVILLIIAVIGTLSGLAFIKYQAQQAERAQKAAQMREQAKNKPKANVPQDVAIMRVDEGNKGSEPTASKAH